MWQDLNDIVHVQDINNKEILSFHNFPTYGQVMTSDLKYFASNENLDLYENYGNNQKLVLSNGNQGGFIGLEKLLNLTLSNDNQLLLTSGSGGDYQPQEFTNDDGVALWNVNTRLPIRKFPGNSAKTIATISTDNKYIISGDEAGRVYVWDAMSGKQILELRDLAYGKIICKKLPNKLEQCQMDFSGYPSMPKYLLNQYGKIDGLFDRVYNLKFIDLNGHYLHFTTTSPYTVLYQAINPLPLKYLSLGKYPWPVSKNPDDYSRDEAIDTAPAANILVMAQADGPGIIVYKFDPKTLTLKKIWAPGADNRYFLKNATLWFLISLLFCFVFNLKKYPTIEKIIFGIAVAIMILAIFPLYTWGLSAGLFGLIIGILLNHIIKFPMLFQKNLEA